MMVSPAAAALMAGLDGGIAAVADEQERSLPGAIADLLDAIEEIGPLSAPAPTCQPAWLPPVTGSASATAVMLVAVNEPVYTAVSIPPPPKSVSAPPPPLSVLSPLLPVMMLASGCRCR